MVGPKPSTHDTCTICGMIGNNSCGASAQAYGKMADSVARMEVLTYDGTRMWVGPTGAQDYQRILAEGGRRAEIYRALRELVDENLALIRTRYPHIPRRVSGYNLDALLPENGFDVARALVGSESTLVTVLRAEIALVPVPKFQSLVVLGFEDIAAAGDARTRRPPAGGHPSLRARSPRVLSRRPAGGGAAVEGPRGRPRRDRLPARRGGCLRRHAAGALRVGRRLRAGLADLAQPLGDAHRDDRVPRGAGVPGRARARRAAAPDHRPGRGRAGARRLRPAARVRRLPPAARRAAGRRPTRSSPTPPNMPRTPPGAGSARPTTPASTARCCSNAPPA